MDANLSAAVVARLGASVCEAKPLAGGSINAAWAVGLDDGRRVFVKSRPAGQVGPGDVFASEARGLAYLRAGLEGVERLRVPEVIACDINFLVLELFEPGPPCADFDELLGRGLAGLHESGSGLAEFGLDHANYIGSEAQPNDPRERWPEFYRDLRLRPMLARADARGLITPALRRRFDALFERLATLCGDPEPPARLHGDLWGGNLIRDHHGCPILIDPAVYAGHREVDLAMMRLFGGFGGRSFEAYAEVWPLQPGWERRVHLYQLYPLLVHVVLFGRSYLGALESALDRLA